jgi:hypothetical protein
MPDERATQDSEQQEVTPPSRKFPRARLIAEASSLVGYPGFVVAGALHDVRGTGDVSIEQARNAVDKYHQKEA